MEDKLIILDGSYGDGYKDSDYLLSEGDTDRLPTLQKLDTKRFYYNQYKYEWSKKSCTIFSAIGAISDLFNYQFSDSEIKEIDNLSYNEGRNKNSGWYDGLAVKLVADRWNGNKNLVAKYGKVIYYSFEMKNDALVKSILDKNYNICSGYYGNSKYNSDYQGDLCLDGTEFGASTYGHAVNYIGINGNIYVKDNYDGRKYNVYKIANPLSKIRCLHTMGYIFTTAKVDNTEEIKRLNEIKTLCNNIIPNLGTLYNKVNDKSFQAKLHETADSLRKKVVDCDNELKKYL